MTLSIAPLYAGLLALFFIHLSSRVIKVRRDDRVSLGDGGSSDMAYRIRAQANFTEYAPLGIILLAMIELQGLPFWAVHILGLMLLIGRVTHGWAMSQTPQSLPARTVGTVMTLTMISMSALANIGYALL